MLLNLSELISIDGKEMDWQVPIEMTEFRCRQGKYLLVEKQPVAIHGVHKGKRKVTLNISYELALNIPCDRCLEPVAAQIADSIEVEVDLNITGKERAEALDEQPYIEANELDVDCLIQGEILLNLPDKVLCSQECKGICRVCGTNLNQNTCSCSSEETVDLRMSKFQEFFKANNFKEV